MLVFFGGRVFFPINGLVGFHGKAVTRSVGESPVRPRASVELQVRGANLILTRKMVDVSENKGFSPQTIPFLIGSSIIFTIHFGGNTPIFGNTMC